MYWKNIIAALNKSIYHIKIQLYIIYFVRFLKSVITVLRINLHLHLVFLILHKKKCTENDDKYIQLFHLLNFFKNYN